MVNLPNHLGVDAVDRLGKVAERHPSSGIDMRIFDQLNLDYREIGGLDLFQYYRDDSISAWEMVFRPARHTGEIEEFRQFLMRNGQKIAALVTPSEVEDCSWYQDDFCTQTWKFGSAKYSDCLVGSRNVYVWSAKCIVS